MPPPPTDDLEDKIHEAFVSLIQSFERWFQGAVPNSDAAFASAFAPLASDLTYVFPSGGHVEGEPFFRSLREGWGTNPAFRLRSSRKTTRILWQSAEVVLAQIVEMQDGATAVARPRHARRTTLFFLKDDDAPFGLRLKHLHETFLPPDEEDGLEWVLFDRE